MSTTAKLEKRKRRDRRVSDALFDWGMPVAAAALAAVAPLVLEMIPRDDGAWLTSPLTLVLAVLVVGSLGCTAASAIRTYKARERERGSLTKFSNSMGDTISILRELVDSDRSRQDRTRFFESMVREAKSLIPLANPRICVYELDSMEEESGAIDFLKFVAAGGRPDLPRRSFKPDTAHGQNAIDAAKGTSHKSVDNPKDFGDKISRGVEAQWESFIIVPLRSDRSPWGMLTIDTTVPTRFTQEHIAVALVLARFMELGLEDVKEAADDPHPEVTEAVRRLRE